MFKVIWDRSIDKDIGDVRNAILQEPTLDGYEFPNPHDPRFFANIESEIAKKPDLFRLFQIGFSLCESVESDTSNENIFAFIEATQKQLRK